MRLNERATAQSSVLRFASLFRHEIFRHHWCHHFWWWSEWMQEAYCSKAQTFFICTIHTVHSVNPSTLKTGEDHFCAQQLSFPILFIHLDLWITQDISFYQRNSKQAYSKKFEGRIILKQKMATATVLGFGARAPPMVCTSGCLHFFVWQSVDPRCPAVV